MLDETAALEVMELTPAPVPSGFAFLGTRAWLLCRVLLLRRREQQMRCIGWRAVGCRGSSRNATCLARDDFRLSLPQGIAFEDPSPLRLSLHIMTLRPHRLTLAIGIMLWSSVLYS